MKAEAGLILEGGGMRGVYTAGVLDCFLDEGLIFKSCYAVSAGACHACSYLSRQRGRAFHTVVDYLNDKRYCSIYSLLTTGDLFGVDLVYNLIPNQLNIFDHAAFEQKESDFYVVVTNCVTGQAEYMQIKDLRQDIAAIQASSSLPLLSRMVEMKGGLYLDGGIGDSIPIRRSIFDGHKKNVVVLTQCRGHRKEASRLGPLLSLRYRKYPAMVARLAQRHREYNETLDFIEAEEQAGRTFVIQPQKPVTIGRVEKNREKLTSLYEEGYRDAQACTDCLKAFFSEGVERV